MEDARKHSQCEQILGHLRLHGSITPLVAFKKYGCMRLGARIWDLKKNGHSITVTNIKKNGKHYAKYTLN
jgi:hypothetical protein